jgi:ankyrin repeat protein
MIHYLQEFEKLAKGCPERFKQLVEMRRIHVNMKDSSNTTILHVVCWCQPSLVEFLILKGAKVNARNIYGSTPLHWAQDAKTIKCLIRYGANVHTCNNQGENPLQHAVSSGRIQTIRILYEHGSRIPTISDKLLFWLVPGKIRDAYQTLNKVIALYAGMCWKRSDVGGLPSHILLGYMV